jgi:predicted metalloprotease
VAVTGKRVAKVLVIVLVLAAVRVASGAARTEGSPGRSHDSTASAGAADAGRSDSLVEFVAFVLEDVQGTWRDRFAHAGRPYRSTSLVLFSDAAATGCGPASSDSGPFYCPADERVYLDPAFFEELEERFGAPGDFAQAYVIAHEVGHHVQHLLGVAQRVSRARQVEPWRANDLSVGMELQADCYAGVWARSTSARGILEPGDLREGLTAAAAVGDDRIQAASTGTIDPETWTHGSAEQRAAWFGRGFDAGDPEACDAFAEVV